MGIKILKEEYLLETYDKKNWTLLEIDLDGVGYLVYIHETEKAFVVNIDKGLFPFDNVCTKRKEKPYEGSAVELAEWAIRLHFK